jgi:hypothetical protein
MNNPQSQIDRHADENGHKDELTDFLSSQFNLESMDSGLPSMDSKDVEDIFKGVLVEESHDSSFTKTTNITPVQQKSLTPPVLPVPNAASSIPNPSIIPATCKCSI